MNFFFLVFSAFFFSRNTKYNSVRKEAGNEERRMGRCRARPSLLLRVAVDRLDEGDVVALQHDSPDLLPGPVLDVALAGVVQDEVHVLVEADDAAFHPGVDVLVQPDGDEGPVLKVAEDQVDGLDHHLLDLGDARVSHRGVRKKSPKKARIEGTVRKRFCSKSTDFKKQLCRKLIVCVWPSRAVRN